jgi:hypothetical protein
MICETCKREILPCENMLLIPQYTAKATFYADTEPQRGLTFTNAYYHEKCYLEKAAQKTNG